MKFTGNGTTWSGLDDSKGLTLLAYLAFLMLILAVAAFLTLSVKRITVGFEGKSVSYFTFAPTVEKVLKEVGITGDFIPDKSPISIGQGETINYLTVSRNLQARATDGVNIRVYKNRVSKTVEKVVVSPPVRREWDIFMPPGKERIISPGSNGLIENFFLECFRDGVLISRKLTNSRLVIKPKPVIIASGSYETVSRQGFGYTGTPQKFVATAYALKGKHTAVGADTRRGIVAVDPKIIPLGSKLFIKGYGYGIAADTGEAIRGNRIDLFFESYKDALKWGRKTVDVYILEKPW